MECGNTLYTGLGWNWISRIRFSADHVSLSMRLLSCLALTAAAFGHPLGNFSVNHYAKLQPSANGVEIYYVIDMAEIPTFEMLREWGLERTSPREKLDRRAAGQGRKWITGLAIRANGTAVSPVFRGAQLSMSSGSGNLPLMRICVDLHVPAAPGAFQYEDRNFDGRAGWKEIVVEPGPGASIRSATQSNRDLTHALLMYPPDPSIPPPQELRANIVWIAKAVEPARKPSGSMRK